MLLRGEGLGMTLDMINKDSDKLWIATQPGASEGGGVGDDP